MSAVSGGGGGSYISDGQIMAWLAEQQGRIYGDLRDSMGLAEQRADFTDKLNNIKSDLAQANRTHDFSKVNDEMKSFMDTYADDPNFAELCEGLKPMFDQVEGDFAARQGQAEAHDKWVKDSATYTMAVASKALGRASRDELEIVKNGAPKEPPTLGPQGYDENQMKDWDTQLGEKTDATSKNDQLTMIHIQELKATLDQGSQLASTFISSGDKTQSAIINNIA